ncbi:MAG: hypothetical protein K8W52_03915 [Deltaproteobacteria bacterium]|nr:hypothetical protein [Deltaproteobacteria bacterium]
MGPAFVPLRASSSGLALLTAVAIGGALVGLRSATPPPPAPRPASPAAVPAARAPGVVAQPTPDLEEPRTLRCNDPVPPRAFEAVLVDRGPQMPDCGTFAITTTMRFRLTKTPSGPRTIAVRVACAELFHPALVVGHRYRIHLSPSDELLDAERR